MLTVAECCGRVCVYVIIKLNTLFNMSGYACSSAAIQGVSDLGLTLLCLFFTACHLKLGANPEKMQVLDVYN